MTHDESDARRVRLCGRCKEVYSGTVSCPYCDHIPRTDRASYCPPAPCEPWQADLSFDEASLSMTVEHEGQRRLIHEIIRIFGGGPRNG